MRTILCIVFFSFIINTYGQTDKVLGVWLSEEKTGKVEIYKKADKYFGKVVWISPSKYVNGEPKKDVENPDVKLRTRSVLGIENLKNFVYDADDKEWDNGTIYDPQNGTTYDCYMWFEDNNFNTLFIRGYVGFSLIGRTTEWTKSSLQ
ncbi:MAG: SIGNAL peptide protein [Bacteroidetes bacterium GWF2_33_38]|nr:MAG: SIGNAL peptide protein [Bacteroidetes bacterium GWF2_33_38]OFY72823.1 MAG: SIGNAL peptide protein [Bacteroidetes bacterium RIFOXYA12_FULL_33_9]HBX52599.1 DUF2147 domain-containing protein [Bacteroidales bacterium]